MSLLPMQDKHVSLTLGWLSFSPVTTTLPTDILALRPGKGSVLRTRYDSYLNVIRRLQHSLQMYLHLP